MGYNLIDYSLLKAQVCANYDKLGFIFWYSTVKLSYVDFYNFSLFTMFSCVKIEVKIEHQYVGYIIRIVLRVTIDEKSYKYM